MINSRLPKFPLTFKGKNGEIKIPNRTIEVDKFKVTIKDYIIARCQCKVYPKDAYELELIDDDGWKINISNFDPSIETHYGEDNFFVLEAFAIDFNAKRGMIEDSDNIKLYKILECYGNKIEIHSDDGFTHRDLKDMEFIKEDISDLEYSIGYFFLEDKFKNIKDDKEEIFENLSYLLSLFVANFVSIRISILFGVSGIEITASPINKMSSGKGISVFYYDFSYQLSNFLNSTYKNYLKFKEPLNLPAVFRHYIRMKDSNHHELILLMGSILMECLKYHYAKYLKVYRQVGNDFYKKSADHKPKNKLIPKDRYSFRELVEEIYEEFKVVNRDTDFIKYRNKVVHQGTFEVEISKSREILDNLETSIQELIFNILQYKGRYKDGPVEYNPPTI